MPFKSLFDELKRRHVLRVVGFYLVGAWVLVEVTATVFPLLGLPERAATYVVLAALLGLPIAAVLAWVFDITPEGVRRTDEADARAGKRTVSLATRVSALTGVLVLVGVLGVLAWGRYGPGGSAYGAGDVIESIAVLPFADMSPAGDQEYFADGITEELLNTLAKVDGLQVAARTSSFAFKGRNEDITEIGRELRVDAVLEGSVRRDGETVRITAQLIDTATGYHLWSETYDRRGPSIFAVQDELARSIVDELSGWIAPASPMVGSAPADPVAHELFLLGLSHWNERTDGSLRQAADYFRESLERDDGYAMAHAMLAQTYAVLPTVGDYPVTDAVTEGMSAAAQALALDHDLAEAHAAMGQIVQNFEWDFDSAERSYRRALAINRNYAQAHQWFAEALMMQGRLEEALAEVEQALVLDPLSPATLNVKAYVLLVSGETDRAIEQYESLAELHPGYAFGNLGRGLAYMVAERYGDARAALRTALPDRLASMLATVVDGVADPAARPAALDAAAQLQDELPLAQTALWYALLGAREPALAALERAYETHSDANLPYLMLHPGFDAVRGDPRFREIADLVGLGGAPAAAPAAVAVSSAGGEPRVPAVPVR